MKYHNAYKKAINIHLRRKYTIEAIKKTEEKEDLQKN
jgi:hypothetical protein